MSIDAKDSRPIAWPVQEERDRGELALLRRCRQLSARLADLTIEAGTSRDLVGLTLIGRGTDEILVGLSKLAPKARRTVWNMQPSLPFDPVDPTVALNDLSRARGVDLQLITSVTSR